MVLRIRFWRSKKFNSKRGDCRTRCALLPSGSRAQRKIPLLLMRQGDLFGLGTADPDIARLGSLDERAGFTYYREVLVFEWWR